MPLVYDTVLLISTLLFGFIGTGIAYVTFKKLDVVSIPNERSNHAEPTPHSGGLGIVLALVSFLFIVSAQGQLIFCLLLLAAVSFWDDLKHIEPKYRLTAQAFAVIYTLGTCYDGSVFAGLLPRWVELPILALAWMWFINLFNFMDGSDGMASSEAVSICVGLFVLTFSVALPPDALLYSMVVVGSVLGFALWNWHPAKIFMGDAGSIPLGYLIGFMLISLAGSGYWHAALILPAFFVADATSTLFRRLKRKAPIMEAHSEHGYQQAIRAGHSHDEVARQVIALNIVLIVLAVCSTINVILGGICLVTAYLLTSALLYRFHQGRMLVAAT